MKISTLISTSYWKNKFFLAKVCLYGRKDIEECFTVTLPGIDSNPTKGMKAVYDETAVNGEDVVVGYINKDHTKTEPGEIRIFSWDESGEKAYIKCVKDGTMEIGGNSNYAVKYNELKQEYDKTKAVLDAIVTILKGSPIPEPGNGANSALQTALSGALTGKQTGDISSCKNDKIKTI